MTVIYKKGSFSINKSITKKVNKVNKTQVKAAQAAITAEIARIEREMTMEKVKVT